LTGFIRQAPVRPVPAQVRVAGIAQAAPEPAEDEDYGSYRQRYLDIQRRMELGIGPFRQHCREASCPHQPPPAARLAQMDATLEDMLGERAQALLAKLSALLVAAFSPLSPGCRALHGRIRARFSRRPGGGTALSDWNPSPAW